MSDHPKSPRGATAARRPTSRREPLPLLLAGLLVLALAAGTAWWFLGRGSAPVSSSAPASQGPRPTPAAAPIEVPGPGTVEAARAHLVDAGFRCEAEKRPGIDSWLCTHYTAEPTMSAYLGGASGHRLGRASLNVQAVATTPSPQALELQRWLAGQVLGAADAPKAVEAVRAGTAKGYATTDIGDVHVRGAGDGSIVLFVDGWVPATALPADVLPARPLAPALAARGYTCTGSGEVHCTRTAQGVEHTVDYTTNGVEVSYLKVRTASSSQQVAQAAAGEVKAVTGLFQEGRAIGSWLAAHAGDTAGATGFAGLLALDWYPGASLPGGGTSVFYLRGSCWTDTVETC